MPPARAGRVTVDTRGLAPMHQNRPMAKLLCRALPLLLVLVATFAAARPAAADHDDGDDVKEYRYLLCFDGKELAPYAGFLVVREGPMDQGFVVTPTLDHGTRGGRPDEIALSWAGHVPTVVYAFPTAGAVARAGAWARQDPAREPDGALLVEPATLARFESAFRKDVVRIGCSRSPLLSKLLALARCKVHFLEEPKDRLKTVREEVRIRATAAGRARLVPVRYVLEYDDGSRRELTAEAAAALTSSQARALLRSSQAAPGAASGPVGVPGRAWSFGAPAVAVVLLAGLAASRR